MATALCTGRILVERKDTHSIHATTAGLAVALIALALVACSSEEAICTMAYIPDTASAEFAPAIDEPGVWSFEVEAGDLHCVVQQTLPDPPMAGLGGAGSAEVSAGASDIASAGVAAEQTPLPPALESTSYCPMEGPPGNELQVALIGDDADSQPAPPRFLARLTALTLNAEPGMLPKKVPELTYHAYLGDELRHEGTVIFDYEATEPHGVGCGFVYKAHEETRL